MAIICVSLLMEMELDLRWMLWEQSHGEESMLPLAILHLVQWIIPWQCMATCIGLELKGLFVFSMDSEDFSQMAYPAECNAWYQNHIITMARYLGLCKVTPQTKLEIWILKDHARRLWIKQYTISTHGFMNYSIRLPITLSEEEILLLCRDYREHQDSLIFYNATSNALEKFDIEGLIDWRSCKTFGMPFTTNFDKGSESLV